MKKTCIMLCVMLLTMLSATAKKTFNVSVLQWNIWQEGTIIDGGFESIVNEIARLKPDFVTLSEVRNYNKRDFTAHLVTKLKQKGVTYYSFYSDDSGLLSRYPIKEYNTVFPLNKDHGSIYKLIATVNGREFAIYTCHLDYLDCAYYNVRGYDGYTWKETKRPETVDELLRLNDLSWRNDEAKVFINEAKHDLDKGRIVIFGGDFNEPSHLDWVESTKQLYDHHGMIVPWTVSTMLYRSGYKDSYRVIFPNPLTHPGFTYPSYNPAAKLEKLTWAPKSDERERIDLLYFQGKGIKPIDAKIFGYDTSVVRCAPQKETSLDSFIAPVGVYPSDHKGLLVTYEVEK